SPSPSIRMPANLAPASRRSFGHLIASRGLRSAATSTTASWIASAATNESCGQRSAAAGPVSNRLAERLPGGRIHGRPARPPPAARALPLGGDPERPALALTCQIESLGVGRAEHFVCDEPHARRGCPGLEFHPASSFIQTSAGPCAGQ